MAGLGRKVWAADEILAAADLQSYIQDQTVMRYANSSARASGILSPTEGMVSYLDDTNALYVFDGSAWVAVIGDLSVTTAKLANGAVTDVKVSDVAASKITGLTGNSIVTTNSSGVVVSSTQITTSQVANYGTGTWTGTVSAGGNAVSGGNASFTGTVNSSGGYTGGSLSIGNNAVVCGNITSPNSRGVLSGSYNVLYIDTNGLIGITASSERFKQDIVSASIDAQDVLNLELVNFRYKTDVEQYGDDAPVQLGMIAEQVEATLGSDFVFYDDEGRVQGVHYDRLSFALLAVVQEQQARLDSFEARLTELESK